MGWLRKTTLRIGLLAAILLLACSTQTNLRMAVKNGHPNTVAEMLKAGVDPDTRIGDPAFPVLYQAAEVGDPVTLKVLLDAGADVEAQFIRRWRPIHIASSNGNTRCVEMLLDRGAAIQPVTEEGYSALFLAAQGGYPDTVATLLAHGAAVDVPTEEGRTPLHVAASKNYLDVVRALLEAGADPNVPGPGGSTAISMAAAEGHHRAVTYLAAFGARIDDRGDPRRDPVLLAGQGRHREAVMELLEAGAVPTANPDEPEASAHAFAVASERAVARGDYDRAVEYCSAASESAHEAARRIRASLEQKYLREGSLEAWAQERLVDAGRLRGCLAGSQSYISQNNCLMRFGMDPIELTEGLVRAIDKAVGADQQIGASDPWWTADPRLFQRWLLVAGVAEECTRRFGCEEIACDP